MHMYRTEVVVAVDEGITKEQVEHDLSAALVHIGIRLIDGRRVYWGISDVGPTKHTYRGAGTVYPKYLELTRP